MHRLIKKIVRPFKGHWRVDTTSASNCQTEPSPMESSSAEPHFGEPECSHAEPSYAEPSFAEPTLEPSLAASSFANPTFAESEYSPAEYPIAEPSSAKPSFTEPESSFPLLGRTASASPDRITFPPIYYTGRPSVDSTEPQLQPSSLQYSPFKELLIELFLLIASFLPLPAAASLTLICRSARIILGSQYLDLLQGRVHERREFFRLRRELSRFLQLLARDLPRHIACIQCVKLHSRTQKQVHKATPCKKADHKSFASLYIHPEFDSITFLLAMNLHRSDLDYSDQLSRLSGFGTIPRADHIQHWESTPRIVNGHFLLRNKTWLLFDAGVTETSMTTIDVCICRDWHKAPTQATPLTKSDYPKGYTELATQRPLTNKLSCRASHWDNAFLNSNCATCTGLFQCKFCPTEFQIGVGVSTENGVALTVTRWLDLGKGRSLEDRRYASHVYGYEGRPVRFKAGSIKAAYEGGDSEEKLVTPKYTTGMFKRRAVFDSHTAGSTKANRES
ncbi:hypothetical protein V500_05155 [Pseudogymnoascus sp. VKM F-4518 (FW-2643)]|nr:hypothetical protein V500_05155 [Pseudogymnoascus sp. VKM F-4518 (FW-2643)]